MSVLSIVTPTYNRINLLQRCLDSLMHQSSFDFEWIVVDDGSSDGTDLYFQSINPKLYDFPITYIKKENGGKHTALNAAIPHIHGEYVLFLDSDDYLFPESVEIILHEWENWESDPVVGMLIFEKQLEDGRICCSFENAGVVADVLRQKRIYQVSSDCCEVFRSQLLQDHPFPVFNGERFLSEIAFWYTIGIDHACVCLNIPVYVCEYQDDGLTGSGKKLQIGSPRGSAYTSLIRMNRRCSMKERLKAGILFVTYSKFAGNSVVKMIGEARKYPLLFSLTYIPGCLLYRYWKGKYQG